MLYRKERGSQRIDRRGSGIRELHDVGDLSGVICSKVLKQSIDKRSVVGVEKRCMETALRPAK